MISVKVFLLPALCGHCGWPRPYNRRFCSDRCRILDNRKNAEEKETRKEYRRKWAKRKRALTGTVNSESPDSGKARERAE